MHCFDATDHVFFSYIHLVKYGVDLFLICDNALNSKDKKKLLDHSWRKYSQRKFKYYNHFCATIILSRLSFWWVYHFVKTNIWARLLFWWDNPFGLTIILVGPSLYQTITDKITILVRSSVSRDIHLGETITWQFYQFKGTMILARSTIELNHFGGIIILVASSNRWGNHFTGTIISLRLSLWWNK